jgi:hypothetical protein
MKPRDTLGLPAGENLLHLFYSATGNMSSYPRACRGFKQGHLRQPVASQRDPRLRGNDSDGTTSGPCSGDDTVRPTTCVETQR